MLCAWITQPIISLAFSRHNINEKRKENTMTKKEIITFLYYLLDKIDVVYLKEVEKSIDKFINDLNKYYK